MLTQTTCSASTFNEFDHELVIFTSEITSRFSTNVNVNALRYMLLQQCRKRIESRVDASYVPQIRTSQQVKEWLIALLNLSLLGFSFP